MGTIIATTPETDGSRARRKVLWWLSLTSLAAEILSWGADWLIRALNYFGVAKLQPPAWLEPLSVALGILVVLLFILYIVVGTEHLVDETTGVRRALGTVLQNTAQASHELCGNVPFGFKAYRSVEENRLNWRVGAQQSSLWIPMICRTSSRFLPAPSSSEHTTPPLTLLENHKENRDVIYEILQRAQSVAYEAIVGIEGAEKICHVYDLWMADPDHRGEASQVLQRMLVACYDHPARLHCSIDFGALGQDLRGLSFFVVERGAGDQRAGEAEKTNVLLYVLGEPFAKTFEVPTWSLKIVGRSARVDLYQMFLKLFSERWGRLRRGWPMTTAPAGNRWTACPCPSSAKRTRA